MQSVPGMDTRLVEGVRVRFYNSIRSVKGLIIPTNLVSAVGFDKVALDIAADQLRMDGYKVEIVPLGTAWELKGVRDAEHYEVRDASE